jgi:hypothetical protein
MPATAKKFERPNVHRIAEEELYAAGNDADAAVTAMVARIEDDDALFRSLMQTALYDLCAQAIQGVIGRRRRVIWDEPSGSRFRFTSQPELLMLSCPFWRD